MGSERTENCDHACDGQATCVTGRCDKDVMFAFANRDATLTPEPLAHILYDNEDAHRPMQICDANGQVVLSLCKICNKGEAELIDEPCVEPFIVTRNGPNVWACMRGGDWNHISMRTYEQLMARGKTLQRGDLNWAPQAVDRARRAEKPGHDVPITFIDGEPDEMPDAPPSRGEGTPPQARKKTAADMLDTMAATFRTRNAIYDDTYRIIGAMLHAIHPRGIHLRTAQDHEMFNLWSLMVVKLSRFAHSNFTHRDSVHDAGVYAAIIEALLEERANKENKQ